MTPTVNYLNDLVDLGVQLGLIQKSGNWMRYRETKLGNGRGSALEFLRDEQNADVFKKLEAEVKSAIFPPD
jgi:recombination protein RecA